MIEFLFIIDFLENLILQRPKGSKQKFKKVIKEIKSCCVNNCKEPNFRYKEIVKTEKGNFKIMATTTDDNILIGVLSSQSQSQERHVWKLIENVFELIKDIDIEDKSALKELKPVIDDMIDKTNEKNTTNKIMNSLKKGHENMEKHIKQTESDVMMMADICLKTEEMIEDAQTMESESKELYKETYWYDKKLWFFITGLFLLLIILSCWIIIKLLL